MDRAFLRDVIKLTNVDAGGGYVIFGLPPSEVAVHQHDKNDVHEFYLMCADVEALIEELKGHKRCLRPSARRGHCKAMAKDSDEVLFDHQGRRAERRALHGDAGVGGCAERTADPRAGQIYPRSV